MNKTSYLSNLENSLARGIKTLSIGLLLLLVLPLRSNAQIVIAPQPYISSSGVPVGPILFPTVGTSCANPPISFVGFTTTGFYAPSSAIRVCNAGTPNFQFDSTPEFVIGSGIIGWTGGDATISPDLKLSRLAAGNLYLANSTNPQTFTLANTDDGGGNWERLSLKGTASNAWTILSAALGTGVARDITIQAGTSHSITIKAAGGIVANDDAAQDIGVVSTGRFRNAFFSGFTDTGGYKYQGIPVLDVAASSTIIHQWGSGGITLSAANGVIVSNNISSYNGVTTSGSGIPYIVGTTGLLAAQGANITTTNIPGASSVAVGLYEVCVFEAVTRAATSTSTMPDVDIAFNNGVGQTFSSIIASSAANTTNTVGKSCVDIKAAASTAITYATRNYATSGVTSMQYELFVTARAIF